MTSEHEHRRRAWLATLCALLVVAAFLAAKAARDAILLSQFSVTSLPLFVGLSAVLALPVIIIAGKLMTRHGPHRLVPAMNAVSAAVAVVEWMISRDVPRFTAVLVFFHLNTAGAVLVSGFWSIINERFDVTTAKRHIGRIGMGATFGGILGGVVAERTAVYFPQNTILLVLAIMQFASAVLLWVLGRGARIHDTSNGTVSTWSALGGVARSHLLRKAGLVVVITAVAAGALDYVFKADIVQGGSRADLLSALAIFYTVTNIVTAIVQVVLCGPALSALGVPRTVATLPVTITGFSIFALLARVPMVATVARGAELVTRNSLYRAGYELLYAPLPPEQKRPTKVVLDVGADKLGDIISAQLVAAVLWLATDDRSALLLLALIAGAVSMVIGFGIPRSYTQSLEEGLLEKASELPSPPEGTPHEPWVSLAAMPVFGHPGESVPLRMRRRRRAVAAPPIVSTDKAVEILRELRSNQPQSVIATLGKPLPVEAIPAAIELVGSDNDDIARAAAAALRAVAPRCTGALIDILLDPKRPDRLRRRMPAILTAGMPELAAWGLWRGLRDASFEVRYRSAIGLSMLAGDAPLSTVTAEEVFERVRHELLVDRDEWKARKLAIDAVIDTGDPDLDAGLAHVFRMLGLVLPAEPLRVALRAAKTDDAELRGMALEYLESILPPDVRAQVWPLLDEAAEPRTPEPATPERQQDLLAKLRATHPALFARKAG